MACILLLLAARLACFQQSSAAGWLLEKEAVNLSLNAFNNGDSNEHNNDAGPDQRTHPGGTATSTRLKTLSEMTVGLLDISKPRGKEFLDEVQTELEALGATCSGTPSPHSLEWHPKSFISGSALNAMPSLKD